MSIFSLKWFKSRKQQELEALKVEEQTLKNEILRKRIDQIEKEDDDEDTIPHHWTYEKGISYDIPVEAPKPYLTVKMVNDVLTVVLRDGSILSKTGATPGDYVDVKKATSEEQIANICSVSEVVAERKRLEREREKAIALQKGIQLLEQLDDFEVVGNSVYLTGVNRSMPQLLVEEFLRIVNYYITDGYHVNGELQTALNEDEEFQSLKRFFMWCCLNPRAEVADKLYNFLKKNSFRITKQGFFVALRNVVTIGGDKQFIEFISNAYNKVKAVWKKDPTNYWVYKTVEEGGYDEWYDDEDDNDYTPSQITYFISNDPNKYDAEMVGNLKDLYLDLPNMAENRYTDAHTRTFDIRVGRPVSMDPGSCRWNTDDCGAEGLHFTSDEIHYVGCGDTSVLILINPMKVVGIGESKGRCWEYLPIMTVPRVEATEILHDLDFDTLELDEDYAIRELESLTERAKLGFAVESCKHQFNIPHISTIEIESIVASLDEMRYEISKRVKPLD